MTGQKKRFAMKFDRTKYVHLVFWLRCSKQTRKIESFIVERGLCEELKREQVEDWTRNVHPGCSGNLSYGWRYAR